MPKNKEKKAISMEEKKYLKWYHIIEILVWSIALQWNEKNGLNKRGLGIENGKIRCYNEKETRDIWFGNLRIYPFI